MKHYLLLLFLATGLCACVDENSNLGHTLVNSSFYNVYVDTCTVDISTVLEDSMAAWCLPAASSGKSAHCVQ